jgi:NAD(P)-dependent dehydrogenase (short-subunit alcohol dehydrogenase family)
MTTALVTGANRGIGLELVKQLKARGDTVIAACRSSSAELDALGVRVEKGVDVASADAAKSLAHRLEGVKLDVLIHNAGILLPIGTIEALDEDAIRKQFEVNALGPLRLTSALLPNLAKGSKIGIVTSRMGSIADNTSGGSYGYRMSKVALNMAAVSMAHDLRGRGISVIVLHPGYVKTDMTRGGGTVAPADAAKGLLARIDALTPETSGTFAHANGETLPW